MQRETKELKIQDHTFLVKSYATQRELHTIQQALFKGAKIGIVGDQPKLEEFNPGAQFDMECELVKTMVISMDDNSDFFDVLDQKPADLWQELVAALDPLVSKKELEEAVRHYSMGRMDDLMQTVAICEKFGWTYEEYHRQPAFFLTAIKEKMVRDHKAQEMAHMRLVADFVVLFLLYGLFQAIWAGAAWFLNIIMLLF